MTTPQEFEQSSFLFGSNANFIGQLYGRYLKDQNSVDASWVRFFSNLKEDQQTVLQELRGAPWTPGAIANDVLPSRTASGGVSSEKTTSVNPEQLQQVVVDSLRALRLIEAYRTYGHLSAQLDPLGLQKPSLHPALNPKAYGFDEAAWDRPIFLGSYWAQPTATLREVVQTLQSIYCSTTGIEYMHLENAEQRLWIQERIEKESTSFSSEEKKKILKDVSAAEGLEKFLQVKFVGAKRFGLEGGEALMPALEESARRGAELGLQEIAVGMAHRGRLNVLTNFIGKPFRILFAEFQGKPAYPENTPGSGDVKYHMGYSHDRIFGQKNLHLSLATNPSHLESVNPVVAGKVRAKQQQRAEQYSVPATEQQQQVMSLLIHGDAAFAGQGMVMETLMMSQLEGYSIGGTLHFVINNQVGFTTNPGEGRSGPHATDVAKMIDAPIFHVNGDDVEAVVRAARLATEFRQKFLKDVVVDIVCYRRHGHNETDEPAFTQPLMYKAIHAQTTTRDLYAKRLITEGVLTTEADQEIVQSFHEKLESEFKSVEDYKPIKADWLEGKWKGLESVHKEEVQAKTDVSLDLLKEVGKALTMVPTGFRLNSKIERQLKAKEQMFATGSELDWGTAEALAFGSLLTEGYSVRLSGQDVGRGTFSHRHAVFRDQENGERYIPLNHIQKKQAFFEVYNSPLSEAAVMGFEHGYALSEPHALVLWEAQFGDFVNGAQVIIDQYISSSESKWLRLSGLVLLLPHGYEGQGPEHSSARPERFLQLCAEDNMQVANCTTPASYFHILRRQLHRKFRKPLVIMTPKSLLRHKMAVSALDDFGPGSTFRPVLSEIATDIKGDKVQRVVLCTGKVYYDLLAEREKQNIKNVALVRVEELYPFPAKLLEAELSKYPNADVVWCQEEPQNMGYWFFMDRRIEGVLANLNLKAKRPSYVGRPEAASPATGFSKRHDKEQAELVATALKAEK